MATDSRVNSYYIHYGFTEGPLHSRKFERALQAAGFRKAETAAKAYLIIGHSVGCAFSTQPGSILIDPSVWPSRSYGSKFLRNFSGDFSPIVRILNVWYLFTRLRYNLRLLQPYRQANRASFRSNQKALIIRNQKDAWCGPEIKSFYPNATIKNLPGNHSDCWRHPEEYIELILDYAK